MGTEVLRPHDLLAERFRIPPTTSFHHRRNFPANGNLTNLVVNKRSFNNSGYHKKTSPRSDKKKPKDAAGIRRKDDVTNNVAAMGKVTLLRRGESFDSLASKINGGNDKPKGIRLANHDLPAPKQIRVAGPPSADMYAGSAFSMSPSPRSLPLPSFFNKQPNGTPFDDPASRDLRRLLRLE